MPAYRIVSTGRLRVSRQGYLRLCTIIWCLVGLVTDSYTWSVRIPPPEENICAVLYTRTPAWIASLIMATSTAADNLVFYNQSPDGSKLKPVKLPILQNIPFPPVTEHEKSMSGELYNAFDETLVNGRAFGKVCCYLLNTSSPLDIDIRQKTTKDLLGTKGEGVWIEPPFYCDYGSNIHLGTGTHIDANCTVLDEMPVCIGPRCSIGPGVNICTATHPTEPKARSMSEYSKPVTIGADCWIGGGTIIVPGVTIGDCVVVETGSVVTKDVPSYTVVAGNPARKVSDVPRMEEGTQVLPSQ